MEAGEASLGGLITGPIKPPFQHPEFQGSVPAKWMDRGSGYLRGKPLPHSDITDGFNGIARQGLGPFGNDSHFRVYEESLRRTKQFPSTDHHIAPWGDHPAEVKWKPSRRKLEDHEFEWRVGPKTLHSGLLSHIPEPDLLSKQPAFVPKGGTYALPAVYDPEVERTKQAWAQKQLIKRQKKAAVEHHMDRSQVLDLENWERSHVRRPMARSATLGASSKSSPDARLQRSQSESGQQFVRQSV